MPLTFHKYAGVCPVCSKRFYEYGILLAGEPMQVKWSFFHFGSWGRSNAYCCTADNLVGPLAIELGWPIPEPDDEAVAPNEEPVPELIVSSDEELGPEPDEETDADCEAQ